MNSFSPASSILPSQSISLLKNVAIDQPRKPIPSFVQKRGLHKFALIEKFKHFLQAVEYIRTCEKLAVDCEGVALSKTGKLCLIQIATQSATNGQCIFIFDILNLFFCSFFCFCFFVDLN
jgi:hypothetical protein